ncbi:hypothetical protein PDJAM_G00175240 [Pangasius djambal]|uniref:Uncharacterized protein n=1 Tax=Pangasius djambal TaxID=1691987 RepID=A0ACC5ZMS1_9TELE|nr:hypothetical protein [Pangasius djambal]
MEKQQCPPGFIQDSLVKDCISHDALWQKQKPVTEAVMVMSTVPPAQCWNFAVWISVCVVFVLSSSVLVLLLWVIIYRRHTHGKRNSECPGSHHHNVNSNSDGKEDSCPHVNGRKQEVSDCEMGWGRGFCKARAEPAVPLPATELGDSALVTTKTVQQVDYSHCDASLKQ